MFSVHADDLLFVKVCYATENPNWKEVRIHSLAKANLLMLFYRTPKMVCQDKFCLLVQLANSYWTSESDGRYFDVTHSIWKHDKEVAYKRTK